MEKFLPVLIEITWLVKLKLFIYNGGIINMGEMYMSVVTVLETIIKEKHISKGELAERIGITKQNMSNKIKRDNFSALELVEIADALDVQLILKDGKNEYRIDYPADQKGKPKRNMTTKEKEEAVAKARATKNKHREEKPE